MNRELNQEKELEKQKDGNKVQETMNQNELVKLAKKFWEELKKPQNFQG
ncbi:hypothetical protein KTD15_06215 [Burkholderia multivorans]|nr:hypothetical protein [Burkholderia multivorans]MBU9118388.1 hypothetical protein [Burkholderia multivorans]